MVKNRDEGRERERNWLTTKNNQPKSGTTLCLNGRQTKEEEKSPENAHTLTHTHTHTHSQKEIEDK